MMKLCDQHQIVYDFGYNRAQSVRCPVCLAEREIDQHERENEEDGYHGIDTDRPCIRVNKTTKILSHK